jgi:hypothetical protein
MMIGTFGSDVLNLFLIVLSQTKKFPARSKKVLQLRFAIVTYAIVTAADVTLIIIIKLLIII